MNNHSEYDQIYAEAFYGGDVPSSQLSKVVKPLRELIMLLTADIKEKRPDIDAATLHQALIAALKTFQLSEARHPNVYKSNSPIVVEAFQTAMIKIRYIEAREEALKEKREEQAQISNAIAERNVIASQIYDLFNEWKEWAFKQGYEYPALEAWKTIIKDPKIALEGYVYYLVAIKLPQENDIYEHPELIKICCSDPRLPDRGESRMKVNGENWKGIS